VVSGVFTIGTLGPCPPPLNCEKISRMAKNATKMRHFQAKISKGGRVAPPLSEILNTPLPVVPIRTPCDLKFFSNWGTDFSPNTCIANCGQTAADSDIVTIDSL